MNKLAVFHRFICALLLFVFAYVSLGTTIVSALSEEQLGIFNRKIYYYDVDACSGGTAETVSTEIDGDLQELAEQMLANSKITYWTNNGVNTRDVVVALSKGEKAYTTAPDGQPKTADMNPNILKFILDVAETNGIMVNALTDKDHSSTSNHYKGLAVDLEVTQSPDRSVLDPIAAKYGGTNNGETGHHHYDFLERPKASEITSSSENLVYMLGDSITVGATKDLEDSIKPKPFINASVSRSVTGAGSTPGLKTSGLQAADDNKIRIEKSNVVVVALGTNQNNDFEGSIKNLVNKIEGYNDDASIYWVNVFSEGGRNGYNQIDRDKINKSIAKMANEYDFNVIDTTKSNISTSDSVHPDAAGYKKWTQIIVDELANAEGVNEAPDLGACECSTGGAVSGEISPEVGKGMSASAQTKFQEILVAAGDKFDVNPNFVAAFYYSENARTGDSTNNANSATPPPATGDGTWREPAPPYGNGEPYATNEFNTAGAFQFIPSTWAAYGADGNGDGNKDAANLADGAFGAANYLAALGGKNGASEEKLRVAAFGYNHSDTYVQSVINVYKYLTDGEQSSVASGSDCTSGQVSVDGYVWPVDISKAETDAGYPLPCASLCHHDNTPAFDLATKETVQEGNDTSSVGRSVAAISDGKIEGLKIYNGIAGCYALQFVSDDGYKYWYGHLRKPAVPNNAKVKAGDKIAEIGERKCTGNGSYPHLHIDRGSPKGNYGGSVSSRDKGMVDLINKLYESLP